MASTSLPYDPFTAFKSSTDAFDLPKLFTYPFYYQPHPLARLASEELQNQLDTHSDRLFKSDLAGNLFGVLVVKNPKGQIGYLSAYSGQISGIKEETSSLPYFVPPIVDLISPNGFYQKEKMAISKVIKQIATLENTLQYQQQIETYAQMRTAFDEKSKALTQTMKKARAIRKVKRNAAKTELSSTDFKEYCEVLKNESLDSQHAFKRVTLENEQVLAEQQHLFIDIQNQIDTLKMLVAQKEEALKQKLRSEYAFLNADGISKNITELFYTESHTDLKKAHQVSLTIHPGTGDCVAPKLLQYAFANNYTPICFAQFWWGSSPISETRRHGYFYPACHGKCKPILTHMLSGTPTNPDPILQMKVEIKNIDIVYEDDAIAIINKPYNIMSETGNDDLVSVESILKKRYPDATGPLLAHRLDMATSGIMIIVKSIEHYRHLQKQFINRTIKKSYIALLDGDVSENCKAPESMGTIDLPLRLDIINKPNQIICYETGKPAITKWSILEKETKTTRVLFEPVTGRTHQLRVHAAHTLGLNSPIVGDTLYGKYSDRMYLHAYSVSFMHPTTSQQVSFTIDPDF